MLRIIHTGVLGCWFICFPHEVCVCVCVCVGLFPFFILLPLSSYGALVAVGTRRNSHGWLTYTTLRMLLPLKVCVRDSGPRRGKSLHCWSRFCLVPLLCAGDDAIQFVSLFTALPSLGASPQSLVPQWHSSIICLTYLCFTSFIFFFIRACRSFHPLLHSLLHFSHLSRIAHCAPSLVIISVPFHLAFRQASFWEVCPPVGK